MGAVQRGACLNRLNIFVEYIDLFCSFLFTGRSSQHGGEGASDQGEGVCTPWQLVIWKKSTAF